MSVVRREGLTASSEHALGGRLIDWRRAHALVCPEWPRWAEKKGLRLDERGALLYPNETGPVRAADSLQERRTMAKTPKNSRPTPRSPRRRGST